MNPFVSQITCSINFSDNYATGTIAYVVYLISVLYCSSIMGMVVKTSRLMYL